MAISVDPKTTRRVRTRSDGSFRPQGRRTRRRWTALLWLGALAVARAVRWADPVGATLDALVLQPAHFVMELGVLRGVKRRVERAG